MWSDAARASSLQVRSSGGGGGSLQGGLASAGASSRGAWGKGKTGKQPTQRVTISGEKAPGTGGRASVGAAHQRGVDGIKPNMGANWSANVAANAYATGPRPLVPTGDGGYRYQKFDD